MGNQSDQASRRKLLYAIATAGVTGSAGCSGGSGDSGAATPDTTTQSSAQSSSSTEYRWSSFAADAQSSRATTIETQFSGLSLAKKWTEGGINGFVATSNWFGISVVGTVKTYAPPERSTRWSASRLGASFLSLVNGQLHTINESNSMYRKIDTETGDVVNEFDLSSILDIELVDLASVPSIVLVDEQYAYAAVSGGIAAVDHTVNPPSVSWTNSDIGYHVRRAVRTGEYVITSKGISRPGMTTLAADSGQTVASTGQQSGSTRYTRVSSGSAGTYAYRGTSLVRIDPADLSVMWEAEDVAMRGGATGWAKAVGNDGVFVPQTQKGLTAVEADSGTVRWRVRGDILTPGISANAAYAYGSGGSLLEIDIDSGEVTTEVKDLLGRLRGTQILATVPNPSGVLLITNEAVHLFS